MARDGTGESAKNAQRNCHPSGFYDATRTKASLGNVGLIQLLRSATAIEMWCDTALTIKSFELLATPASTLRVRAESKS